MHSKILLVEDDFFISSLYVRVLTQAGYQVSLADDGSAGVLKAQDMPDLILLDVMLPKMNGIEVLRALKKDPKVKNIPVVLLTNLGQENIIKEAFQIGAQGYFLKMRHTPYEVLEGIKRFLKDPAFKMDIKELDLD